jgi:hypothetical protein
MRNVFVFGCSIALVWQAKRPTRTTGREIERGPNEAANTMSPDIAMTAASLIETPQGLLRSWAERLSHCRFVTREAVEDAPIVVEVFAGRVLDQTCRPDRRARLARSSWGGHSLGLVLEFACLGDRSVAVQKQPLL